MSESWEENEQLHVSLSHIHPVRRESGPNQDNFRPGEVGRDSKIRR